MLDFLRATEPLGESGLSIFEPVHHTEAGTLGVAAMEEALGALQVSVMVNYLSLKSF